MTNPTVIDPNSEETLRIPRKHSEFRVNPTGALIPIALPGFPLQDGIQHDWIPSDRDLERQLQTVINLAVKDLIPSENLRL